MKRRIPTPMPQRLLDLAVERERAGRPHTADLVRAASARIVQLEEQLRLVREAVKL